MSQSERESPADSSQQCGCERALRMSTELGLSLARRNAAAPQRRGW